MDLVGLQEIADRLGVKEGTARMWRYRHVIPEPLAVLKMGPVWDWPTIESWAIETGRIDP